MNNIQTKRVAVLGGGVAGIMMAAQLSKNNFSVDLLEKEGRLGGLHKSIEFDNLHFDIGTFTFNSEHEYFRVFPGLESKFIWFPHDNTSLTPALTLDNYPLSFKKYAGDNGSLKTALDAALILYSKFRYRRRETLPDYIRYYIGSGIYKRSGLKNYIERLYFTEDNNIDLEFARKRMQVLEEKCSLRSNFKKVKSHLNKSNESVKWHCRLRPEDGFKTIYAYIEEQLREFGVDVQLNTEIESIFKNAEGKFVIEMNGKSAIYDEVISTIPMEIMAQYLGINLAFTPQYMKLVSLFYRFKGETGFKTSCLYNFSNDGQWKRITNFSQYYGKKSGEDYFTVECTQPQEQAHSVEKLQQDFEKHIAKTPVLKGKLELVGSHVTDRAYPLYKPGDATKISAAKQQLLDAGIRFAGRQGGFDYSNSFDIAKKSRVAAEIMGK